jgi:hypothetical protein
MFGSSAENRNAALNFFDHFLRRRLARLTPRARGAFRVASTWVCALGAALLPLLLCAPASAQSCPPGTTGLPDCLPCPGGTSNPCSGHGTCFESGGTAVCACQPNYSGIACQNVNCPSGTWGPSCLACPGGQSNPCSGHGTCSQGAAGDGTCTCNPGFQGADCSTPATARAPALPPLGAPALAVALLALGVTMQRTGRLRRR